MHVCRISGNINTHDRDRAREGEVAAGSMRHEHPGAASRNISAPTLQTLATMAILV